MGEGPHRVGIGQIVPTIIRYELFWTLLTFFCGVCESWYTLQNGANLKSTNSSKVSKCVGGSLRTGGAIPKVSKASKGS